MTDMNDVAAALVQHFERIETKHMRGLPIVNPRLMVEAVGFREFDGHQIGVLITTWFMNLVLLPGTAEWADTEQGSTVKYRLPGGSYDFTLSRDKEIGTYLTAVLFRTVIDFPDQDTARAIAAEILRQLFVAPKEEQATPSRSAEKMSRRTLFAMLGGN